VALLERLDQRIKWAADNLFELEPENLPAAQAGLMQMRQGRVEAEAKLTALRIPAAVSQGEQLIDRPHPLSETWHPMPNLPRCGPCSEPRSTGSSCGLKLPRGEEDLLPAGRRRDVPEGV
jgi:hypothetical protein